MADQQSTFMRDLAAATAGDAAAAERNAAWRAGAEHVAAEVRKVLKDNDHFGGADPADAVDEVINPFVKGAPEDIYGDGYRRGVQEACKEFRLQYRIYEGRPAPVVREFGKFCAIALDED